MFFHSKLIYFNKAIPLDTEISFSFIIIKD